MQVIFFHSDGAFILEHRAFPAFKTQSLLCVGQYVNRAPVKTVSELTVGKFTQPVISFILQGRKQNHAVLRLTNGL